MSLRQRVYFCLPVVAQNALVSAYGYYLRHKRYGGAHAVRALVDGSRVWTPSEVEAYQARQLSHILNRCAERVPYYRRMFSELGVRPEEIRTREALGRIPILAKEIVRRRGDELIAPGGRPYWTQHTSGSTGTPLAVQVNRQTYQLVHALLRDHEGRCGVSPTDLRATFAGRMVQPAGRLTPPFWRYNHAERQLLCSAYHLSDRTLPAYVGELTRRQPVELIGYPSAIGTVAGFINSAGLQGNVRPKVVITNSETLFDWQRREIEAAFGCPVRDYYGSAESVVLAAQCSAGVYHFDPLLGIAEIVDDSGVRVGPGERGRLVCTTLTNDLMPLVRYEIGDDAVRLGGRCACGSPLDGASEFLGRHDDAITTPDGRQVGRMDHIFKGVVGIRECQIVQEARDLVSLLLVTDDVFDKRQETLLRRNACERLGEALRIEILRVPQIPRTRAGKFRGVLSRVNQGAKP